MLREETKRRLQTTKETNFKGGGGGGGMGQNVKVNGAHDKLRSLN